MFRPSPGGAFEGLRVIDVAQVRSGPTCVKQFADFGADVIRIESPPASGRVEVVTGPRDGADMQNLHRNKRLITLDLKAPRGREVLHRLVATADVLVENYRPDVKVRLGIDYDTLSAINPRIVLASISGFGQDGPYRDRPGFDQIAQGMCGLMSVTGRPGEGPMRAGAAVVDVATGLYAALGVMTALFERQKSGRGQWVQASLLQSGLGLMDFQAARWLVDRQVPPQVGNDHPTSMPTSAYPTADGWLNLGAGGDAIWTRLCAALGAELPGLRDDPRFAKDTDRAKNRAALNETLAGVFRGRTTDDWIERLNALGVPCGPILRVDEVFADPQVVHGGMVATVPHPTRGELEVLAPTATLSRTPGRLERALGPKGWDTDGVLAELGYSAEEVAALRAEGTV
ncbi:MAG: CoA transferase [Burkholderiaceae bacterium]|jgi:crotonobetainyl-CoA:carnitine CoA-transferase CaiB-like acyl-CoA transferase|nr:CoA transferase [Burkholderiales bacterium]MCZ8096893.1 CoA transferase [Burkholderiales bacterium]MCZ8339284.1 CoA transferase [Burkholderiaceae bacterium]